LDAGDVTEARVAATKLHELNPPAPLAAEAARALTDADLLADAKPLVENIPDAQKSADAYVVQARLLEMDARYEAAHAAFQKALTLDRNRADVYEQAGLFLARHGHAADGVQLLDSAGAAVADSPNTQLVKAGLLIAATRAGDAETLLKQMERRWPDWPQPYVTYGILLEGQKRAADAKAQLETAMSLGASGTEVYYYLAKSTLDASPERVSDASKAIEAALATAPDDPGVQSLAGRIDYQQKRYDSAIEHLQTAVKLRPEDLPARFALAQAYRAVGRADDAARESKEFQRLRAANPNADAE
jgi:predicted Zn-dependent protease